MLLCASLTTLAACGGEDTTTESAPPAASAPASPTTSAAEPPSPSAAAVTKSDKELCEATKQIGEEMKASVVKVFQGDAAAAPAAFGKILTDLDQKMTALAASGGDGAVTAGLKQFAAESAKAAKAADPVAAADNPTFEKVGTDLTAACKAAGVDVNF
ncbi:hypothetical protein GA0074692_6506 [Micromonospora pallida]|uniref:Uncharacterized protein n=1 Tax=Micromonospora pallida TaxID=145854 RepID=A0A1C6TJ73_9ACTN|nr:hypothetical protein GA0074692_6506 [Micromonospora pallida]